MISRRSFLKRLGGLAAAVAVGVNLPKLPAKTHQPAIIRDWDKVNRATQTVYKQFQTYRALENLQPGDVVFVDEYGLVISNHNKEIPIGVVSSIEGSTITVQTQGLFTL